MNYADFMASLAKGDLPHVFLLAGEEPYYIARAEAAILRRVLPDENERADALIRYEEMPPMPALAEALETIPFFTEKSVVLVHGATLFGGGKKKDTAEEADAPVQKDTSADTLCDLLADLPPTTYAVFTLHAKPDKRKKIYKAVEKSGRIMESEALRPWTIEPWLNARLREMGRAMHPKARAFFFSVVQVMETVSLEFLDSQLEKLALYTDEKTFTEDDLRAAFSEMPEVSVFALMDSVNARDAARSLALLDRCLADGVYFTVLLALLTRNTRQLWQAKRLLTQGIPPRGLGAAMKLNPYIAEKIGRSAQGFRESTLEDVMIALADADYLMKTGQGGEELLEDVVIRLCKS